jgi:hypothetical protein
MCLIKGAFVGEKNFNIIKMNGTTIKTPQLVLQCTKYVLKTVVQQTKHFRH